MLPPSLPLDRQIFNPFLVAFGEEVRLGVEGDAGKGETRPAFVEDGSTSGSVLEETAQQQASKQEATLPTAASPAAGATRTPPASAASTTVPAAAAAAGGRAAAAATTTVSRTLRQEGETEGEPSIPNGGGLAARGLVKSLPANVGLMTLMQVAEEEGRHNDEDNWEAPPHAFRPASESSDRLTLLVRRKTCVLVVALFSNACWVGWLPSLLTLLGSVPPHEGRGADSQNLPRRLPSNEHARAQLLACPLHELHMYVHICTAAHRSLYP